MESFLTTYRENFVYPYYVPLLVKPSQPPKTTKETGAFLTKPREEDCDCGMHSFNPMKKKAEYLLRKEEKLICELLKLKNQRLDLDVSMLDHPCGNEDETMKSLYEINYSKKGFPIVPYRKLMPDKDDTIGVPQAVLRTGLNKGYRDPTSFRKTAIVRPTIDPPRPLDITAEPRLNHYWTFGRSEYQDTISKMGHSNIMAIHQFKEPLPASRRRVNNMDIRSREAKHMVKSLMAHRMRSSYQVNYGLQSYSRNSTLGELSNSRLSVQNLGKMNKKKA